MPISRTMGPREWGLLAILSVLWGGSFFFIGVALRGLPPLTLVLARVALGSLVLFAVLRVTGGALPRGWRVWRVLGAIALLNNVVPFTLLTWSQTQIASGLASILNATTPLWGVLVAHLSTTDERATPGRLAGVALGFAGVVLMIGGDALAGLGGAALAQGACLLATLCYALAGIQGRQMKALGVAPISAACGQLACSAAVLLLPVLLVDMPWRLPPPAPAVWGALAGLVLLSTALAFVLYYRLLATAGATNLLLVTFLIPVTAIALGALFLGEVLQPRHGAGLAFLAAGLAAIDGRLPRMAWRRLRR
ncbi:ABC transporter permease [Croceibacterium mercuriale]|uniref:ABC transporter permease n=1 Tax=Croceibacterium mercuriale TaxID=1572751 RepID=A0A0B2BT06_9SPHN|nr:DMT family transporter [Croceibacterium mercuriale]KHL24569.1 ABC transporter permease [Croceibacterium mercuriale]